MNIRRRVAVLSDHSDRIVCFMHSERITALLRVGKVEIVPEDGDVVRTVRVVTAKGALEDARAGSYGIHRERIAPGPTGNAGIVFAHKSTQEKAIYA